MVKHFSMVLLSLECIQCLGILSGDLVLSFSDTASPSC